MTNLFKVQPNQSDKFQIVIGRENAIKYAKYWRSLGAAPVFVYTVKEVSWFPGVPFSDEFVYCADSNSMDGSPYRNNSSYTDSVSVPV